MLSFTKVVSIMVSFHSNGTVTKVYNTVEFYSPIKKNDIKSFAGKWLPLDIIVQAILYKYCLEEPDSQGWGKKKKTTGK